MKAQEVELALEEVEKAGEEQAKFGKCLGEKKTVVSPLVVSTKFIIFYKMRFPLVLKDAASLHRFRD